MALSWNEIKERAVKFSKEWADACNEEAVNIKAAYLMGKLHDALKDAGYSGHELEKYLVRILFCLFAEDTSIFEPRLFQEYIVNKTNEDGSDLGMHLAQLFQVLNTPTDKRQNTLDESLAAFPYIDGQLFVEQLSFASFNSRMRQSLLECCSLDWSQISPAIFGSMFQSVMDVTQRRKLGAHYTSEINILKLIKPLFLDKLWKEFGVVKGNAGKLKAFHQKIASLRFLDPACGCGNFLVITYRELRLLELEILKVQQKGQRVFDIETLMECNVDKFYGIECEEFPAQIAQVALWLMDHQMNMIFFNEFGDYAPRIPLKKSAVIIHGNALRTDWDSLLNPEKTVTIYAENLNYIETGVVASEPDFHFKTANVITEKASKFECFPKEPAKNGIRFDYIFGNPPFVGKQLQNASQKSDMEFIFRGVKGAGVLDYVSAWYIKAAQYLNQNNIELSHPTGLKKNLSGLEQNNIEVAFVSTNSISQGEQVGILWNELFNRYKIKIHFAHRTFKWGNEGKANAAVHVVIIGFSNFDIPEKLIYEYDDSKSEPHELIVKNVNPYLIEGKDLIILKRNQPICNVPEISFGSMPNDGGFLILSDLEKVAFLKTEPEAEPYIKPLLSAHEFLNGEKRWCLWLVNINPTVLRNLIEVSRRVAGVKRLRESSARETTKKLSAYPALFGENRQPETAYILIPRVSSENRKYIPIGFFSPDNIVGDTCLFVSNGKLFHFGVLSSEMHIAWVKHVGGRLEISFRYSNTIIYNNFPWPENPTDKQKQAIESAAQKVLDTRAIFAKSSLADLYSPLTMPPDLIKAHHELDKAVDLAYRPQPFTNEIKRIEFLFELYDKYTAGLFAKERPKNRKNTLTSSNQQ